MLDHVSISHESGLVLWSKSYNPAFETLAQSSTRSPVNTLVRDVMIENKSADPEEGVERDGWRIRWTVENGLGLVFVVVFPALLPLTYISDLLTRSKSLFLSLFQPYLQALVLSLSPTDKTANKSKTSHGQEAGDQALSELKREMVDQRWAEIWERCVRGCEERADGKRGGKPRKPTHKNNVVANPPKSTSQKPLAQEKEKDVTQEAAGLSPEEIAKNVQALKNRLKGASSSGRSSPAPQGSGTASPSSKNRPSGAKRTTSTSTAAAEKIMRKWGTNGDAVEVTADAMRELDFSAPDPREQDAPGSSAGNRPPVDVDGLVDRASMGQVGKEGFYEVADWGVSKMDLPSEEEILARGRQRDGNQKDGTGIPTTTSTRKGDEKDGDSTAPSSRLASLFDRLTGKKVLSESDLDPVLREMEKHLMSKNVAKDIAEKLCQGVGKALVGKKLGGMSSVRTEVDAALSKTITQVLSPKTSTDILLDIKRKASLPLPPSADPNVQPKKDPYTMTFIGVNGVGKSTNLSKVAFWLLQNKLRVLIAACDTFRSGAVEQLRVHVRNLGALEGQIGQGAGGGAGAGAGYGAGGQGGSVELFERGYGKDAAGIAKDAIAHAKENGFDVVLIDTAGRMQDNEPLMRALAKLVTVNNPDKIVFVGEALVGNEAVDQLSKFDRSLKDFSAAAFGVKGKARGIDGMILTKFDTIDDKVGAALSMTYITGQPILFVGCGQTYSDIRSLRVNHIVEALLGA